MTRFNGIPVSVLGTGIYVPDRVLTNLDLEKMVDTNDQWIQERTGIKERRLAEPGESTSLLASRAAQDALRNTGLDAKDIDVILVGTCSPDAILPSTACKVQGILGATNAVAMDIQAGCPSALNAMVVAVAGIQSGIWKHALVIGAEVISAMLDWEDRNTCVLFGDAAGACILTAGENGVLRLISGTLRSDGSRHDLIEIPAGGTSLPATSQTIDEGMHFVKMKGKEVFKLVNREMPDFLKEVCAENEMEIADIDHWIFHQANARMIESLTRRLSIPMEKAIMNIDRYGNTCAATIMLLLHELVTSNKLKSGETVAMSSFGAGMNWGAVLLQA